MPNKGLWISKGGDMRRIMGMRPLGTWRSSPTPAMASLGIRGLVVGRTLRHQSIDAHPIDNHPIANHSIDDHDEYRNRKSLIQNDNTNTYYPLLRTVNDPSSTTLRVPEFISQFQQTDFSQYPNNRHPQIITINGKINSIRKSGKAMYFIDLIQDFKKLQIMGNNSLMNLSKTEFSNLHGQLKKGDYIHCKGMASCTKVGELTLKLIEPIKILSPCLNSMILPDKIIDKGVINSNRILNYLINPTAKDKLVIKSLIIKSIREFLNDKQFMEIQTPLINGESTGANAKPFITKANSLDNNQPLQLRVAPELWLKKLVISGFEKIFEIGNSFRNEGIDSTHNPEFTTCEFYQSFIDLPELMKLTEELFHHIYMTLDNNSSNIPTLKSTLPNLNQLITPTFQKHEFIPTLELKTGKSLPAELTSESLIEYHQQLNLDIPMIKSPANLLDNLSSIYLESIGEGSNEPVFIYNQPAALSPLSKSTKMNYDGRGYDISLRFELFINGKEYVNAYEEENSPFDQFEKFQLQQCSKDDYNDDESLIPDWNYIKLLEYGLPPTGGWGCGIDRLAMLFSNSERIDEVLPFGNIRDVLKN